MHASKFLLKSNADWIRQSQAATESVEGPHTTWKASLRTVNTMITGNRKRKAKGALMALCQCLSRIIEEKQARLWHNTSAKITLTSDRAGVGAQNIRLCSTPNTTQSPGHRLEQDSEHQCCSSLGLSSLFLPKYAPLSKRCPSLEATVMWISDTALSQMIGHMS